MSTSLQILFGSALLTACALLHVAIVAGSIPLMKRLAQRIEHMRRNMRRGLVLSLGVLIILLAHTVQVWTWAFVFLLSAALTTFAESFYFAMVTYTTLGYGDLILGESLRIFATFAAVTGLLTFGISTAFLISLLSNLFPSMSTPS
ncbi:potassium channel family protein [uncultured Tateyamaria sp.]|uniref:potassium channel family protein n=1 Tax=uncultured Tateyamaria sp. TaxID=455651 RepID=UPI002618E07D|nr:potassium channel family protein [uncultured Tateyamaria sp.]